MNETLQEVVSPMVEMDAREFGLHLKEGGWRLGLLVARSVEPGEGAGVNLRDRGGLEEGVKISAERFAGMAECSGDRVMRYYRAWERYAGKGKVPHAADLEPGDEPELSWARLPRWSLSELPSESFSGPLNLRVKLGSYGDRLFSSHKRFITFIEKDLPESRKAPSKDVRELAGRYAACLETEAEVLRHIETGQALPPTEELREQLDPSRYFDTA